MIGVPVKIQRRLKKVAISKRNCRKRKLDVLCFEHGTSDRHLRTRVLDNVPFIENNSTPFDRLKDAFLGF